MEKARGTTQGILPGNFIYTVLIIAFGFSCLNACVSKSRYNSALKELDYCEIDNLSLQERVQSLNAQQLRFYSKVRGDRELNKERVQRLEAEKEKLDAQLLTQRTSAEVGRVLYESLVTALSSEIETQNVEIEQMRSGVTVNLPGEVLFTTGSAELCDSGKQVLLKVGDKLQDVPYQTVVSGFTDNVTIGGKLSERYPTNWELAGARASRVVRFLEKAGVSSNRLLAISFGENHPADSNDTEDGRAMNRRIEIRLRPIVIEE